MRRRIYGDEHEAFRALVRDFLAKEAVPAFPDWERQGHVSRSFAASLGQVGVLGIAVPEEYGGGGQSSYAYSAVLAEETARALVTIGSLRCHMDVVLPYLLKYADPGQKARWFPGLAAGELLAAIAMTEPGTGSDLSGMRTAAVRDGDRYVLNGAKTFITGGVIADLVIVVARTGRDESDRRAGLTLLVVEAGMPGFTRGRNLEKLGIKAQDTAELFFTDVEVPVANRLGEEGQAFSYLGHNLARERLSIAVAGTAAARAALTVTLDYVKNREVFGQPVGQFQNTKFELASVATEIEAAQALVDQSVQALEDGEFTAVDAAKAKLFCSEVQGRTMDRCLQLFGGYGYMLEYPIARLYADARVARIYGGTSEVMRSIVSKSLGL